MTEPSLLMAYAIDETPPGSTPRLCIPSAAVQRKASWNVTEPQPPTTIDPSSLMALAWALVPPLRNPRFAAPSGLAHRNAAEAAPVVLPYPQDTEPSALMARP